MIQRSRATNMRTHVRCKMYMRSLIYLSGRTWSRPSASSSMSLTFLARHSSQLLMARGNLWRFDVFSKGGHSHACSRSKHPVHVGLFSSHLTCDQHAKPISRWRGTYSPSATSQAASSGAALRSLASTVARWGRDFRRRALLELLLRAI